MNLAKTFQPVRIVVTLAVVAMLFMFSSCAHKISFTNSTVVPAAEGNVKTKQDDNKNYKIDISVKHLAEANRLQPSRSTYVVWMDTQSNGTQKLGQLVISGSLNGSLQTSSPYKPVRVFISAEDNADISYPGTQVVLTTNNF